METLDVLHEELIDRFGLLPPAASALLETHRLRVLAKPLGIIGIDASSDAIVVQFAPNPPIDPVKIIQFIQTQPGCKLAGPDKIRIGVPLPELEQRITAIKYLFKKLQ
jgi:transcription-repair coupling factor (superfamily II helicase)